MTKWTWLLFTYPMAESIGQSWFSVWCRSFGWLIGWECLEAQGFNSPDRFIHVHVVWNSDMAMSHTDFTKLACMCKRFNPRAGLFDKNLIALCGSLQRYSRSQSVEKAPTVYQRISCREYHEQPPKKKKNYYWWQRSERISNHFLACRLSREMDLHLSGWRRLADYPLDPVPWWHLHVDSFPGVISKLRN